MALTYKQLKNAKPGIKLTRLSDEPRLYLEIASSVGKRRRFRYMFEGKAKMLSLGTYPDISLK